MEEFISSLHVFVKLIIMLKLTTTGIFTVIFIIHTLKSPLIVSYYDDLGSRRGPKSSNRITILINLVLLVVDVNYNENL
jgi:hypothetical protein